MNGLKLEYTVKACIARNSIGMPVFLPSVFNLYSCILFHLVVGKRLKEAGEERGKGKGFKF